MKLKFSLGNRYKYYWIPLIIAVWTILQSMVHVWWLIYGRAMLACEVEVKHRLEFYLYMTYLYNSEGCDKVALSTYAQIVYNNSSTWASAMFHAPSIFFRDDGTMTSYLVKIYLGFDSLWIVTSVGLLIGIILRLKQGSALLFYLPWIFMSMVILAFDIFSSIYYALKLLAVEVHQEHASPWFLGGYSVLAILCGRLGFLCLFNLSNCVYIIWYMRASYKQRYSEENLQRHRKPQMRRQDTENRIKSWQLFYGEIDESTANGGKSFINEEDLTYSTTFKELEDYNDKRKKSESTLSEPELCSTFKSSSSVQQNNAESNQTLADASEAKKNVQIMELVSHLPWSYLDSDKQKMAADVLNKTQPEKEDRHTPTKKVTLLEPQSTTNDDQEQMSRF